jgi:hypothetical protein
MYSDKTSSYCLKVHENLELESTTELDMHKTSDAYIEIIDVRTDNNFLVNGYKISIGEDGSTLLPVHTYGRMIGFPAEQSDIKAVEFNSDFIIFTFVTPIHL